MAPRQPYSGSSKTRPIESGALAARRQDLVAHSEGTTLRHTANDIDLSPLLSGSFTQTTVQEVLQTISSFITDSGQGFIAIGATAPDGYDTGDFNVSVNYPLESALVDAMNSPRLQQGGVILIKSGTYRLNSMVVLKPGIRIMGEPSGTLIISATNQQPMFQVPVAPTPPDLGNWQGIFPNVASTGVRYNSFYNIILADNLDGYKGASPTIPNTITAGNLGLIQCDRGSYLICEKVTFLGKVNTTLNPEVVTRRAIDYTGTSANPTILTIDQCYFDAFESCITFTPTQNKNFLSVKGCRMRFLGQNTGSPPADRASAISFNICNANIEGNYILGDISAKYAIQLRNFALADSQLLEASSATDDLIPRIVLMGNSGGLVTGSAVERAQNFFINSSSNSAFRMVNTGNTWGSSPVNPWGVVIGDGSTSIGDINGVKALDVAVLASQNSRSESIIYINPGNYTYTTGGNTSTFPRLIGNIRGSGQRPIVSLSSSLTDTLSRKHVFVGDEIKNIRFTSISTFHAISMNIGTSNTFRNLIVDNCEFYDAGLQTVTFTNSNIQTLETKVSVLNSRFNQTGSFVNNLSCYITGEIDNILIKDCSFIGQGYAMELLEGSFDYTQNVVLENVYFDGSGDGATDMITVASPTGNNSYIAIFSALGNVNFRDVIVNSVVTAPTEIFPVKASLRSAGTFVNYIYVNCNNFYANNSKIWGPPQTYISGAITYSMPALFIEPLHSLNIDNCDLRGAAPLFVSGGTCFANNSSETVTKDGGALCSIKNSIIASYSGITGTIVNSCMLDLDFPDYTGNRNSSKPKIIIDGCQIENYIIGSNYFPMQHINNTTTKYRGAGGVVIIAKGWPIVFTNNTVHILQSDHNAAGISPLSSVTNTSSVFIDVLGNDSGTNGVLRNASAHINNNDILLNTAGTNGSSGYVYSCLFARAAFGTINNNFIEFVSQTTSESTPYRVYLAVVNSNNNNETTNRTAFVVSNNIFERYQALSKAMIYFISSSGKNSVFSDNVFTNMEVSDSSLSPQFVDNCVPIWAKVRNKNQTGKIQLKTYNGDITWNSSNYNMSQFTQVELGISGGAFTSGTFANTATGGLSVSQQVSASGVYFNWTIPLLHVLPLGARVVTAKMTVVISLSSWGAGSFRLQAGGNITSVLTTTVSATGAGGTASVSFSANTLDNTMEMSLENNPFIIVDCAPTLTAGSGSERDAIINVELTYLL